MTATSVMEALLKGRVVTGANGRCSYRLDVEGNLTRYPGGEEDNLCAVINGLRPLPREHRFRYSFKEAIGRMVDREHVCVSKTDGRSYRFDRDTDRFMCTLGEDEWGICTEFPLALPGCGWADVTEEEEAEAHRER